MANVVTVTKKLRGMNYLEVLGTIVLSGNYATPGESIDFGPMLGLATRQPVAVEVFGIAGFMYRYVVSTKRLKAMIFDYNNAADGPAIETPDGAYPAGMTGDTITFRATFTL